jgi:cadherin-23
LTVKISDVNDNRPVFVKPVFKGTITENAATGTSILSALADDRDLNKTLFYSLEGQKELLNLVSIDSKTGELFVKGKIDRETYDWINITVRATDPPPSSLSGIAKINIQILDENDNNPIFVMNGTREFTVSEDAPIGSLVTQIHAKDDDIGSYGKVTYLLDASSSFGKFKIDRDTVSTY